VRKTYGTYEAVRGIEFEVRQGEIFGLLGPNGAGKTTTIEIL
jgi:ABC-2 type transport system ATP-binding protein